MVKVHKERKMEIPILVDGLMTNKTAMENLLRRMVTFMKEISKTDKLKGMLSFILRTEQNSKESIIMESVMVLP